MTNSTTRRTPRLGTKLALAIAYLNKTPQGADSAQLAAAAGVAMASVAAMLAPYVDQGDLVVCKLTRPGLPPMNQYRLAGSGAPIQFEKTTQPAKAKKSTTRPGAPMRIKPGRAGAEGIKAATCPACGQAVNAGANRTAEGGPVERPVVPLHPKRGDL